MDTSIYETISQKYFFDKDVMAKKCNTTISGMMPSSQKGSTDVELENSLRFYKNDNPVSATTSCLVDLQINQFERSIRSERPQLGETISNRILEDVYKRSVDTRMASIPSNKQIDTRLLLQQAADLLNASN